MLNIFDLFPMMVRLIPSTAIEPFKITYFMNSAGTAISKQRLLLR